MAISNQPQSLTVAQGSNASFSVTSGGTPPLSYQWRFAGATIPGATDTAYTRTNSQCGDAGAYDVIVSNPPYIADEEMAKLPVGVRRFEPHQALQGGPGGFVVFDRLARAFQRSGYSEIRLRCQRAVRVVRDKFLKRYLRIGIFALGEQNARGKNFSLLAGWRARIVLRNIFQRRSRRMRISRPAERRRPPTRP